MRYYIEQLLEIVTAMKMVGFVELSHLQYVNQLKSTRENHTQPTSTNNVPEIEVSLPHVHLNREDEDSSSNFWGYPVCGGEKTQA